MWRVIAARQISRCQLLKQMASQQLQFVLVCLLSCSQYQILHRNRPSYIAVVKMHLYECFSTGYLCIIVQLKNVSCLSLPLLLCIVTYYFFRIQCLHKVMVLLIDKSVND